jgi:rSAM/selenodomain-associated transferase 2
MNSRLTVSVIIPVLNEEKQIGPTIDRLHDLHGGLLHEIIVVDGGSGDKTTEIVEDRNAKLVISSKPGRAVQMNKGAEHAAGSILYFLHADTTPPPHFDLEIVSAVKKGFGAGCFRLKFDWDHPILRLYAWFTRFRTTFVRFGDQSLFVRREIFERSGGFDESLVVMEDQKIVWKLKKLTRFFHSDRSVETSARKYERTGIFRLQFTFILIWIFYYAGISQAVLKDLYKSMVEKW